MNERTIAGCFGCPCAGGRLILLLVRAQGLQAGVGCRGRLHGSAEVPSYNPRGRIGLDFTPHSTCDLVLVTPTDGLAGIRLITRNCEISD